MLDSPAAVPGAPRGDGAARVSRLELTLLASINGLPGSPAMDAAAVAVSLLGDSRVVWLWLAVAAFRLARPAASEAAAGRSAAARRVLQAFLLAALIHGASSGLYLATKQLVERPRPYVAQAVNLRLPADAVAALNPSGAMPSGHAANAFLAAVLLGYGRRTAVRAALMAVAGAVAASRVYLGVHYVSDVVVGGAIGWGVASAMLVWRWPARRLRVAPP